VEELLEHKGGGSQSHVISKVKVVGGVKEDNNKVPGERKSYFGT
jgi:hypothetical protein